MPAIRLLIAAKVTAVHADIAHAGLADLDVMNGAVTRMPPLKPGSSTGAGKLVTPKLFQRLRRCKRSSCTGALVTTRAARAGAPSRGATSRRFLTAHHNPIRGERFRATSHTFPWRLACRACLPRLSVTFSNRNAWRLLVGDAAVLQPHERHQLGVFVDRPGPAVQLAASFELTKISAEILKVLFCHATHSPAPLPASHRCTSVRTLLRLKVVSRNRLIRNRLFTENTREHELSFGWNKKPLKVNITYVK